MIEMTLYIYRTRHGYTVSNGTDCAIELITEGVAVDFAVRLAQDSGSTSYVLNYHRPS
jgi:hypothetical protein